MRSRKIPTANKGKIILEIKLVFFRTIQTLGALYEWTGRTKRSWDGIVPPATGEKNLSRSSVPSQLANQPEKKFFAIHPSSSTKWYGEVRWQKIWINKSDSSGSVLFGALVSSFVDLGFSHVDTFLNSAS